MRRLLVFTSVVLSLSISNYLSLAFCSSSPFPDDQLEEPPLKKQKLIPPSSCLTLPEEILQHIFSYLPRSSQIEIRQTSSLCQRVIDQHVWPDQVLKVKADKSSPALRRIKKLPFRHLLLDFTSWSLADLRSLTSFENLTSLTLWELKTIKQQQTLWASLAPLQVKTLNVGQNRIKRKGASGLGVLTSLTALHIGDNLIGDEGLEEISKLTGLRALNVERNEITKRRINCVTKLGNLTSLNISGNSIEREGCRAISALINLHSLNLEFNYVDDSAMKEIGKLTNLTWLNVSSCHITDEGAQEILRLSKLEYLFTHLNYLSYAKIQELQKFPLLKHPEYLLFLQRSI